MAVVPLVPQSLNITVVPGAVQTFTTAPVLGPTGSAINFSTWTSFTCKMVPPTPVPYGTNTTWGTATGSSTGVITVQQATSDLSSTPAGTAKVIIEGVNVSGDPSQLIASGTLTVTPGS